jgi:hypothetical protein
MLCVNRKYLLNLISFQPTETACDVSDLDVGRVLRCTDEDNIPVPAVSEVPSGSSCDIICPYKEVKAWVTCDDGKWDDYYMTCMWCLIIY